MLFQGGYCHPSQNLVLSLSLEAMVYDTNAFQESIKSWV